MVFSVKSLVSYEIIRKYVNRYANDDESRHSIVFPAPDKNDQERKISERA